MKTMRPSTTFAAGISILVLCSVQSSVADVVNSASATAFTGKAALGAACLDPTSVCVLANNGRSPNLHTLVSLSGGETIKETAELLQYSSEDLHLTETNSTIAEEQGYAASLTFPLHPSPTDPDGIPLRYLVMAKHHRTHALQAYQSTLAWREEYNVDTILSRPHVKYDQIKAIFPHYFSGRDVHGNIIFVQRVGQIQLDLKHHLQVSNDDMYHHLIYVLEYCWNILQPGDTSVMTSVLDLSGVSFSTLHNAEIMSFVKHVVSTMSHHYPSRSHKTLLINAPRWFGALYGVVKPLLRESTRQKIEICSGGSKQDDALRRVLGEDGLPEGLLSTNKNEGATAIAVSIMTQPGPNSIQEQQLREFCVKNIERAGEHMLPVK